MRVAGYDLEKTGVRPEERSRQRSVVASPRPPDEREPRDPCSTTGGRRDRCGRGFQLPREAIGRDGRRDTTSRTAPLQPHRLRGLPAAPRRDLKTTLSLAKTPAISHCMHVAPLSRDPALHDGSGRNQTGPSKRESRKKPAYSGALEHPVRSHLSTYSDGLERCRSAATRV
jgi:hypothetical protein